MKIVAKTISGTLAPIKGEVRRENVVANKNFNIKNTSVVEIEKEEE